MTERALLKSQTNAVLKKIKAEGMDTHEFKWSWENSRGSTITYVQKITHVPTESYFIFDYHQGDFLSSTPRGRVARFSPGSENPSEYALCESWNQMLEHLVDWLGYIKRETDEPDLWSTEQSQDFQEKWLESNKPFTPDELNQIQKGLDRVEQFLIEHSGKTDNVLEDIQANIKYLKKAAEKSGRRDWMMMFIGTLISKLSDWAIGAVSWHEFVKILLKGAGKLLKSD